jgi:hypothetical protein
MDFYNQQQTGMINPPMVQGQQINNPNMPPRVDPRRFETPQIVLNPTNGEKSANKKGGLFTIVDNPTSGNSNKMTIPVDPTVPDVIKEEKKRGRKPSTPAKGEASGPIVKANDGSESVSGTVEDAPTSYSYFETNMMIRDTINQIDTLNSELMTEFEAVRHNRTMKNKYNVLVGLSENIGSLIGNRIQAIKEANNSITKSNDLDYKKLKDAKAAMAAVSDDKYIADVYQALITNKQINPAEHMMAPINSASLYGSGIVRADALALDAQPNTPVDYGYLNYVSNMTPEQNLMRYEGNPNVKQVVVFDAQSGAKFFKMMDMSTGQVIENVPVYDQSIMEDTTLDVKNKIAKNINLNETFPIIVLNDNITSQY